CAWIASAIWFPIFSTGFKDVIGSWNTIATSPPRSRRSSLFDIFRRSLPSNVASPLRIRPGGCGISPRIASWLTLLPDPDSPTMPRVSPGNTSNDTPSTAWTTPSSVANSTTRSRIERIGSGTRSALGRVEGVAKPVTDEVDAEDDQHDRQARERDQPPHARRHVLAVVDQLAERRVGRLDPEPEEGEGRLGQDRDADDQGRVDDDRPDCVREHVPEHDAQVAGTGRLGSFDVLLLAQR